MAKFTSEQIISAYKETGSVWRAAKTLGCCGQSVWERLKRLGYTLSSENWSEAEVDELRLLAPSCTIADIARRLGRTYSGVACKISELGIGIRYGNQIRTKRLRGTGLTKQVVGRLVKELPVYTGSIRSFALRHGTDIEVMIKSIQKHNPEFWASYVGEHSDLGERTCPQCLQKFTPFNAKQLTCSRRCAGLRRSDLKYFDGKRNNAIGMMEGICQLCEKEKKSLSAHHIFGKANDPENDYMIALCTGCHQLVGYLGGRSDVQNPAFWETLISLALARKLGERRPNGFHVCVEIEELSEADFEEEECG